LWGVNEAEGSLAGMEHVMSLLQGRTSTTDEFGIGALYQYSIFILYSIHISSLVFYQYMSAYLSTVEKFQG